MKSRCSLQFHGHQHYGLCQLRYVELGLLDYAIHRFVGFDVDPSKRRKFHN
jgi:hypothetical protein